MQKLTKEANKRRVECQAPWNIDGFHLILRKPMKNLLPREINFSKTVFWVQAHNLPLEYVSKENAINIGNGMGKFLEADLAGAEEAKWGNFIRIKVEISVTSPLLNGFWLERTGMEDLWIQLKYDYQIFALIVVGWVICEGIAKWESS